MNKKSLPAYNENLLQVFSLLPAFEAIPELLGISLKGILNKVYQTGDSYCGKEYKINIARTNSGPVEELYFNFIYQACRNELNQIDGIIVFAFEVTDMVLVKLDIQKNVQSFQTLGMAAHFGLVILRGIDYIIEVANAQILTLWERTHEQVIGQKLMDVLPEIEDQAYPELLRQVYESGKPYGNQEEVFYTHTAQGIKTKYVSFYYDPMFDEQGYVEGILVSAHDVTENVLNRKLPEQSLVRQKALIEELGRINSQPTESEIRFRPSIQEAPVPMAILQGRDFVIDSANAMMLKLFGRSSLTLGRPLLKVLPELQGRNMVKNLNHTFQSGKTFSGLEQ